MKNKALVSVIVPVYNIERYIGVCLDSLVKQTYKNIEIIVVNDKSTDSSLEICKEYQKKDRRIKIINNKQNIGLSGTRNAGMKKMSGKYIMFVDGDDWIDSDCIEKCIMSLSKNIDIVLFPFQKEYGKKKILVELFEDKRIFSENETKNILLRKLFGPYKEELVNPSKMDNISSAWGKFYSKSVISGKKFVDTKEIGTEDGLMNIDCFYDAKKVLYINDTVYHYRKNNVNALTRTHDKNLFIRWKKLYAEMAKRIDEYNLNYKYQKSLDNRIIINLLSCSNIITNNKSLSRKDKNKFIKELLNDELIVEKYKTFDMKYLPLIWRVYYTLCKNKMTRSLILFNSTIRLYKRIKWGDA